MCSELFIVVVVLTACVWYMYERALDAANRRRLADEREYGQRGHALMRSKRWPVRGARNQMNTLQYMCQSPKDDMRDSCLPASKLHVMPNAKDTRKRVTECAPTNR